MGNITSARKTDGLDLGSEPNRTIQLDDRNVIVEREYVKAFVRFDRFHAPHLGVVAGHVVAAQEDSQLVRFERVDAMGGRQDVTVRDYGAAAVQLAVPLEAHYPGKLV